GVTPCVAPRVVPARAMPVLEVVVAPDELARSRGERERDQDRREGSGAHESVAGGVRSGVHLGRADGAAACGEGAIAVLGEAIVASGRVDVSTARREDEAVLITAVAHLSPAVGALHREAFLRGDAPRVRGAEGRDGAVFDVLLDRELMCKDGHLIAG